MDTLRKSSDPPFILLAGMCLVIEGLYLAAVTLHVGAIPW